MASMCMTQTSYRQLQPEHPYKLLNDNFLLLQKAQQLQTIHSNVYQTKKQQTIAPATKVLGNSNLHNIQVGPAGGGSRRDGGGGGGTLVPRRKYNYMNVPYGEQLPSVARRNARERNRVKQVNNGFANLRQHLPQTVINTLSHGGRGANKKLSKVDTLRIAVEYIRGLQDMLEASQPAESKSHVANTLCDESSNDGSHYGYSSMGSPSDLAFNQLQQCYNSEVSASPLSSNSDDSDISIGGTNYLQSVKLEQQQSAKEDSHVVQFDNITHFLTEDQSFGDDDSLLECISSWQEH